MAVPGGRLLGFLPLPRSGRSRFFPRLRLNGNGLRIIGDFRRIRAEHLGHIRHIEQGQEHRDPLDNRGLDLVVQHLPVIDEPALDRLHPLPYLVAGSGIPDHPIGQLEFVQFVEQGPAVDGPLFLRICRPFPHPFSQRMILFAPTRSLRTNTVP